VPDFIFRSLCGDEHEFFLLTSSGKPKQFHRTFCEKLLCEKCEIQFGKWESYASRFFYGGMPLTGRKWGKNFELSGVDYAPMKLFLMSLLWRFAATSIPWFKGVDLGPHKEHLRKLLLKSDPAEPWRYGCLIGAVLDNGKHIPDLIVPPSQIRISRERWYRMVVGGFLLTFYGSSHPPAEGIGAAMIQEDGRFILTPREVCELPFLSQVLRGVKNA
jgi:hypothetical protein